MNMLNKLFIIFLNNQFIHLYQSQCIFKPVEMSKRIFKFNLIKLKKLYLIYILYNLTSKKNKLKLKDLKVKKWNKLKYNNLKKIN